MQTSEAQWPSAEQSLASLDNAQHKISQHKTDGLWNGQTPAKKVKMDGLLADKHDSTFVTPAPQHSAQSPLSPEDIQNLLWREASYNSSSLDKISKRSDYISWDEYFMAVALLSAQRSKDPRHPTGCCVVDTSNRIIATGYSGFPSGCSDDSLPWNHEHQVWLHTKNPYVVHAEINALLNKVSADVVGARLYVQHFPCNECTKIILQSRIAEVVYTDDSDPDSESSRASRIMLKMAGVKIRQYERLSRRIVVSFWDEGDSPDRTEEITHPPNKPNITEEACSHRELLMKEADYDTLQHSSSKRNEYLCWEDYFMAMAFLTAQRSKDPNTQVGACIVDVNNRIQGLGYNGFPAGCSDDDLPWARKASSALHQKYLYVCHAEVNAILNKGSADVKGSRLYVALFPCNECSKLIIQAGIREVVYMKDIYHETDSCRASRIMFQMAGVKTRQYIPTKRQVVIEF